MYTFKVFPPLPPHVGRTISDLNSYMQSCACAAPSNSTTVTLTAHALLHLESW